MRLFSPFIRSHKQCDISETLLCFINGAEVVGYGIVQFDQVYYILTISGKSVITQWYLKRQAI